MKATVFTYFTKRFLIYFITRMEEPTGLPDNCWGIRAWEQQASRGAITDRSYWVHKADMNARLVLLLEAPSGGRERVRPSLMAGQWLMALLPLPPLGFFFSLFLSLFTASHTHFFFFLFLFVFLSSFLSPSLLPLFSPSFRPLVSTDVPLLIQTFSSRPFWVILSFSLTVVTTLLKKAYQCSKFRAIR